MVERFYYAITDSSVGDTPLEFTDGNPMFQEPIAFRSWDERAKWVKETRLNTARIIERKEAVKMCLWDKYKTSPIEHIKSCRIYNEDDFSVLKRNTKKSI